jgi:hypothetical protein
MRVEHLSGSGAKKNSVRIGVIVGASELDAVNEIEGVERISEGAQYKKILRRIGMRRLTAQKGVIPSITAARRIEVGTRTGTEIEAGTGVVVNNLFGAPAVHCCSYWKLWTAQTI